MKKTIFISTGEVSGDLQGSLLIEALQRQAKIAGIELEIVALGGDRMAAAGATILGNTTAIGSMGILESLPFVLPTITIQRRAKRYLREHPPDVVVLIDYAGANLPLGDYVSDRLKSIPVVYYIAPQMWVWWAFPRDVERILKMSDRLLAIFPEEARFFDKKGVPVSFVGHPLVDRMQRFPSRDEARKTLGIKEELAVALIPASRRQELKYLMPIIFEAASIIQQQLPEIHYWIPLALEAFHQPIEAAIKKYNLKASIIIDRTSEVLSAVDLAITKSGTVNLELALLNIPQVVIYRLSPMTYWVGKRLFNFSIPFMSPTNLVSMRPIVPELLQDRATAASIVEESLPLLLDTERRQQIYQDYQEMKNLLGEEGAGDRAACEILQMIEHLVS